MRDLEVLRDGGVGERVVVGSLEGSSLLIESRRGVATLMMGDLREIC